MFTYIQKSKFEFLKFSHFAGFVLLLSFKTIAQDEVKGKFIMNKIDQVVNETMRLKQNLLMTDSISRFNLDTIINEATRFKMALRRRNKYAELFEDDFSYYNEQLKFSSTLTNADSLAELINDIKSDMLFKTQNTLDVADTSNGPSGSETNFGLVNFKVRVFGNNDTVASSGFEIYIKRGIYLPSKDSIRIPQLTDNAMMPLSPGNFTVLAWKGNQGGRATAKVYRKSEFICDIKIQ